MQSKRTVLGRSCFCAAFFAALALAVTPAALGGCLDITQGGQDAGAATSPTSPTADAGIVGTACATVGNSQLCRLTSYCPTLAINETVYPNCAFRIRGSIIDIQCVCNGEMLCPLGTPTTCTEAAKMLAQSSEVLVCTQVSEGRCTYFTPAKAGSSGVTPPGSCDPVCAGSCPSGDSGCRRTCGC